MKKLILISLALFLSKIPFAQCHSEEEVNNMPTSCKKAYSPNFMPTKEQEKWLTDIYTSAIEPSISKTKGLRGDWNPEGNYKVTPEGYTKSGIDMYMNLMGCHDNKIYNKYIGMVLVFKLNGFIGAIDACTDELDTIIKNKRKKLDINDMINGRQIYHLNKQIQSDKYSNLAFYTIKGDAKYFVIAKPGIPLFIPVTVRQALEISRSKLVKMIDINKQELLLPYLKPETRADYEKRMATDFATWRSTLPDPEKFISDMIKQLEEQKTATIKEQNNFIEIQSKWLDFLSEYLKTASPKELDKPACTRILLQMAIENKSVFTSLVNTPEEGALVILNPAYFNSTVSKTAPQFISVELYKQDRGQVTLKAFNDFEANLDFKKLQDMLVK